MKAIKTKTSIIIFFLCILFINPAELFAETIEYTLKEYLKQAVKNHPEQKLNSFDPKEAKASYHEAKYSYSPELTAGYTRVDNTPTSTSGSFPSFPQKSDRYSIGVSKAFALTGTLLSASLIKNHSEGGLSSFFGGEDSWSTAYEFSVMQPILRNGPIGFPGDKQLDILKESVKLSRSIHNMKLEHIIFSSLTLYWQLQLNKRHLELTSASLKDSKEMLEKNKRRVKLGTVDIVEVYDFEAVYARTLAEFNNSGKEYEDLKKEFLYTLGIENNKKEELVLQLKDKIKPEQSDIDREKVYKQAEENRKDMEQARLQEKMARFTLDIAKVTMLPQLDFSMTSSFLGDDGQLGDVKLDRNNLNLTFGLQFQMPLDLRALAVVKEKAEVNHSRAQENLIKINHSIQKELDGLIRTVEYYQETEQAYRKTVTLMEKKLKEYKKNYYNGRIDSGSYVRAQDDLRTWQKVHLGTLFSHKLAVAQLEMAQGIFLKKYGIDELNVHGEVQ